MRTIVTLAMKDLLLLWRDKFGMFWILIFPLIFALFFGAIFSGSNDEGGYGAMAIAVVDEDQTDGSRDFITALEESDAIALRHPTRDGESAWDVASARDAVRRGDLTAYVVIPKGFGAGGTAMFAPDAPSLEVGIDPGRNAEQGYLQGLLTEASFQRMQEAFQNPKSMVPEIAGYRKDIAADPEIDAGQKVVLLTFFAALEGFLSTVDTSTLESEDAPTFNPAPVKIDPVTSEEGATPATSWEIAFPQGMIWAIIGCAAGFAISLVQERTQGTYLRLRVSPHPAWRVLAGKALACFLACALVLTLLMLFGHLVFGVRIDNPVTLVMAIGCSGLCFTGMMMFISTLGRTEQGVAGAGWAMLMPFAMLGGGMVPLFLMPSWMQAVSDVSPVKWAVLSLEGAVWRGFTPVEMLAPSAILVGVGAAFFGVGVVLMRRREV